MNDLVYRTFLRGVIGLVSIPGLSPGLDFALRVLGRHHRLLTHLRALQFDGIIDGGANIGEFALLARQALPKADLVCIEPHPPSARRLRAGGFRTIEAALWHENTTLTLTQPNEASTSCTCMENTDSDYGKWVVPAIPLQEVPVQGRRLLIKLDLQGAELSALKGMGDLWDRTAGLLLETRVDTTSDRLEIEDLLRARRFYDYSNTNELIKDGKVLEIDKLWLKEGLA
jgi:FkbM family methyltransferase